MTGFEAIVGGLTSLVMTTVTETAKEESGSSLAKLLKKDVGKAFQQQIYNASGKYLNEYRERHGKLKVVCVRMDAPMELDKLYTAVRVLERSELRYFESLEGLQDLYRESGRRGLQGQSGKQSGIDAANQEPYLMVLGGPGIGKSTMLRKVGLEALKGKAGGYGHPCIPVFLPLQRFKDVSVSIEARIADEFKVCGFPEPEAVTAAMLKKGNLLILLDGLDEVAKDLEDAVIDQIQDFVDRYSNNRFIASCRIAAYKSGFKRFKDIAICSFEDEQIEQFINNWFSAEKDQVNDTAKRCWELLNSDGYKATKELAQTPLLLTLLCAVYDEQQTFPKNRAALYGEALDVVLKGWAAEKRIHNDPIYQDLPLELERELLAELAFNSFVDDQLFFDKRDITRRIREFLVGNLNASKSLDSEAVLDAIEVQQGILTERARDAYSFSHLTFQEYLTAQHIVDNQQIEWLVENHLSDYRWHEVFLLVAGLIKGRTGGDDLLLKMEQQINSYLDAALVRALVQWAEKATDNSRNPAKPAAKRAAVIDTAFEIAFARAFEIAFARASASALAIAFAIDSTFHIDIASDRALVSTVRGLEIFNTFDSDTLVKNLKEVKQSGNGNMLECWSKAFKFDLRQITNMSEPELSALNHYLYIWKLILDCKDSAVRLSPDVWAGIEDRMLTVPKDTQP